MYRKSIECFVFRRPAELVGGYCRGGVDIEEISNVAHSLSAKKRVRQNEKHRARNRARKADIRDQVRSVTSAITAGDFTKAETEIRKATQVMDKVAVKGTIHRNAASRKRSRLTKRLNVAKAAAGSKAGAGTSAAKA